MEEKKDERVWILQRPADLDLHWGFFKESIEFLEKLCYFNVVNIIWTRFWQFPLHPRLGQDIKKFKAVAIDSRLSQGIQWLLTAGCHQRFR